MAYAPSQMKPHERNYPTHDLELATMIFALKIWRCYLYEVRFEIYYDHKILKYLFSPKDLNLRQWRLVKYREDYDFSLQYHLGKANLVANALSRKPHGILAALALEGWKRLVVIGDYNLQFYEDENMACVYNMVATPTLLQWVLESQFLDTELYNYGQVES